MSVTCDGLWKKYGKEDALLQARVALFAFGVLRATHLCDVTGIFLVLENRGVEVVRVGERGLAPLTSHMWAGACRSRRARARDFQNHA